MSRARGARALSRTASFAQANTTTTHFPRAQSLAARLLFGESSAALADGRLATAQTLSGTGALTIAAHLVRRLFPAGTRIFCSDPTWENHHAVIADAGLGSLETYRYWDAASRGLDLHGLLADLRAIPEGSVVMLHAVAHNPTGVDPTKEQCAIVSRVRRGRRTTIRPLTHPRTRPQGARSRT
jgi:aspartate/tyrosine/aromatic aminotransferase